LKNDGTVWAWGNNSAGALGNGNNTDSNVPVQSNISGVIAVARGGGHSLALKSDSTVWAWGRNNYGQLGNGSNSDSNVPVQVGNLSGVIAIEGGAVHSLALKQDGTVWAWGYNLYGSLGNGNNTDSNIPVQASNLSNVITIASGGSHSGHNLAVKQDGTLWSWGWDDVGQLGNGMNTDSNVPVQVIGLCQLLSGIHEDPGILNISIFPNPFSNSISITSFNNQTIEFTLFDFASRKVLQKTFSKSTALNTEQLTKGIYFYVIRDKNGAFGNGKLIKY
jgi:alpha-tubulin suppressor-like RCC1 family protein